MATIVRSQQELDRALADGVEDVVINSPSGVVLRVGGESCVRVGDSATIQRVGDSATIHAYGGTVIDASRYVAIHLHSARANVSGGTIIDLTSLDMSDPLTWCEYHGVPVSDGVALVVKCVDGDLMAGQNHKPTMYPIGGTVSATDWDAGNHCGNGLHFSATTAQAFGCFQGDKRGSVRFLECSVDVGSMVVLSDDKAKAPSCRVLREIGQI